VQKNDNFNLYILALVIMRGVGIVNLDAEGFRWKAYAGIVLTAYYKNRCHVSRYQIPGQVDT